MTARVMCPALDAMLKKTIIALCEVNVQYNVCLEISGSLHIRADGERVFNCLIEEELNEKEKKTRKDSLNDIAGFSIDLAKLHRDSTDSFTDKDDDFEGDDLGCFNLPQSALRTVLTSEDEATLVEGTAHQEEALEMSPASSSQCSKSPGSADVTAFNISDLATSTAVISSATNIITPKLPTSQTTSNLAAIFPTPKVEPKFTSASDIEPGMTFSHNSPVDPNAHDNVNQVPLTGTGGCKLPKASGNPNLNLQAVAIAAAIQRAAEASKKNIGMVLPTQSTPTSTSSLFPTNSTVDTNQNKPAVTSDSGQQNVANVKQEDQSELDVPLTPIGLNFQLALFQNQMAQIQMMQAANASAMLNMGATTLNPAAGINTSNVASQSGLSTGLVSGLAALGATINNGPPTTSSVATVSPITSTPAVSAPSTSKSAQSPINVGNPVRTTTGAKKWQCGFCGILVSSKFYLSSHINAVHTRSRIYPCEMCGRLFYSHGAQRIHKLRYHWVDKRHKCPQCNQMFVLPVELRQHVQRKHKHAVL